MQDMMITRMNEVAAEALGSSCHSNPMQMDWILKGSLDRVSLCNSLIGANIIDSVVAFMNLPSLSAFV